MGNTNSLSGDIFAPEPLNTAADSSTSRPGVFIAGGALSAGSGFIETWWLKVQGNFGSYAGTGENVGDQALGTAHCSFPPGTVFPSGTSADDYLNTTPVRCTIPGSSPISGTYQPPGSPTCAFPPGTVFPPGMSAADYVSTTPPCTIPGDPPVNGTRTTTVTGVDYGMEE